MAKERPLGPAVDGNVWQARRAAAGP